MNKAIVFPVQWSVAFAKKIIPSAAVSLAVLLLIACGSEPPPSKIKVNVDDMYGEWIVDQDAMKKAVGFNPLHRIGLEMYKDMSLRINSRTVTARLRMLGESKSFTGRYKLVSVRENVIRIRAISGRDAKKISRIEFITRDRIRFSRKGEDMPPLIMKRR